MGCGYVLLWVPFHSHTFSHCGKNESTKGFSDIQALWHSGLSARVPKCQKINKKGWVRLVWT